MCEFFFNILVNLKSEQKMGDEKLGTEEIKREGNPFLKQVSILGFLFYFKLFHGLEVFIAFFLTKVFNLQFQK